MLHRACKEMSYPLDVINRIHFRSHLDLVYLFSEIVKHLDAFNYYAPFFFLSFFILCLFKHMYCLARRIFFWVTNDHWLIAESSWTQIKSQFIKDKIGGIGWNFVILKFKPAYFFISQMINIFEINLLWILQTWTLY